MFVDTYCSFLTESEKVNLFLVAFSWRVFEYHHNDMIKHRDGGRAILRQDRYDPRVTI